MRQDREKSMRIQSFYHAMILLLLLYFSYINILYSYLAVIWKLKGTTYWHTVCTGFLIFTVDKNNETIQIHHSPWNSSTVNMYTQMCVKLRNSGYLSLMLLIPIVSRFICVVLIAIHLWQTTTIILLTAI